MKDISIIRNAMQGKDAIELKNPVWMHPGINIYYVERIKGVISVYCGIFDDRWIAVKDLSSSTISEIAKNLSK